MAQRASPRKCLRPSGALPSDEAAQAAQWAPVSYEKQLHDRASYRYFWQILERAHRTSYAHGAQLPAEVRAAFFPDGA